MRLRSVLYGTLLFLALATVAILVGEDRLQSRRQPCREQFQCLVGGFGFGAAVDLSGSAFDFDPRLDFSSSRKRVPIPGGTCFFSRRGTAVFFYPALEQTGSVATEDVGHGIVP